MDYTTDTRDDFPALWSSHQGALLVYIMSAIPQYHDAQDVLQQVAVEAFRKQASYNREIAPFAAWVRGIARFKIWHYRHSHARDRHIFDELTLANLESAQEALGPELDERFAALRSCLQALGDRVRSMMELRYRQGLMPAKIAEQFETSAGAVSVALNKARHALRECIERQLNAGKKAT